MGGVGEMRVSDCAVSGDTDAVCGAAELGRTGQIFGRMVTKAMVEVSYHP